MRAETHRQGRQASGRASAQAGGLVSQLAKLAAARLPPTLSHCHLREGPQVKMLLQACTLLCSQVPSLARSVARARSPRRPVVTTKKTHPHARST